MPSSRAERVHFVVSERRGVGKRLANILLFQVRELLHDLRGGHAVGDEIDNVRYGNTKPSDRGPSCEDIRVLSDAIERVCHGCPLTRFYRVAG